ncbi:transposase [Micromonospora sp. NPDC006431]|uniref:transposase n=1 Tax=Micromonospora sp. NPDC006431 TaxID=3364235 RepID=UPI00367BE5A4
MGIDQDNHLHGDLVAGVAVTRRFDLTDAQWAVLEPLLPRPKKAGRPPKWSKRQLIDGIRWRVRTGAPWRDVPDCYGHWRTVYGLYRRWQRAGAWARILAGLQGRADALGLITWDRPPLTPAHIDSAMPSNAASTCSNSTAPWPRATTNSRCGTKPPPP